MKIIQIMDTLTATGGVNTFVFDLCIALKKKGQDVSLIGIIGDRVLEQDLAKDVKEAGIPVTCLWMQSKKDAILHGVPRLKTAIQEISGGNPTICNLHLKLSVLLGAMATRSLRNVKCVETYHSRYSKYGLERAAMSPFIEKYICCSDSAEEEFRTRFKPKAEKVVSIPNGIDAEQLKKSIDGMPERAEERCTFLSVGRFTDQKNMHVTTAAFAPISSKIMIYKLIGEGPLKEQAVEATKDSKTVEFLGSVPRSEVVYNLSCSDMVVMPSLWEGLSIFMLEAIAMGRPLMISDVESLRAVVKEPPLNPGEKWRRCSWGYIVSTSDVEAYRSAALDFIDHADLKDEMSAIIKGLAKEYSISTTASRYVEVYNAVMQKEKQSDY